MAARRTRHATVHRSVAVLLATTTLLLLMACGTDETTSGSDQERTLNTAGGLESSAPAGTPTTLEALLDRPLEPGRYETSATDTPIRFTIGDGWTLYGQTRSWVALIRDRNLEVGSGSALAIVLPAGAEVPTDPVAAACRSVGWEPFPDDFETWLDSIPGVTITDRVPADIAGMSGVRLDLEVGQLPVGPDCRASASVLRDRAFPEYELVLEPNSMPRMWVLGNDSEGLIVSQDVTPDLNPELVGPVIESLDLG